MRSKCGALCSFRSCWLGVIFLKTIVGGLETSCLGSEDAGQDKGIQCKTV